MDRNQDSNVGHNTNGASRPHGAAAERLRRAVTAATTGSGTREEVQEAARTLVAELRGRAGAPEQMLIEMKALLADAGLRAGYPAADENRSHENDAALYRDIITWSIRCYYEDGKGNG
jgi:hypothetical protein